MSIQFDQGLYYIFDPAQPDKKMSEALEFQPGKWDFDKEEGEFYLELESDKGYQFQDFRQISEFTTASGKIILMHEDDIHLWPDKIVTDVQSTMEDINQASHDILAINAVPNTYALRGRTNNQGILLGLYIVEGYSTSTSNEILELLYKSLKYNRIGSIILPAAGRIMEYIEHVTGIRMEDPKIPELPDHMWGMEGSSEYEGVKALYRALETTERLHPGEFRRYLAPLLELRLVMNSLIELDPVIWTEEQQQDGRSIYSVNQSYTTPITRGAVVAPSRTYNRPRSPARSRSPSPARSPRSPAYFRVEF